MWPRKKNTLSHTDDVVTRIEKESNAVMAQVERLQEITNRVIQNKKSFEVTPNDG